MVPWSELVEPGRSAAEVVDNNREVHECRCAGTRLELLPATVAVGLASELLFRFSRLSGGVFLPRFGSRVGVGWAGLRGGSRLSAITSSPTLVIFSGVRESRLSPSELELSLDSRLFPRLRGVIKSDSSPLEPLSGSEGGGGGLLPGSTGSLPSESSRLAGSSLEGGPCVPPFPSGRRAAWKCGSTECVELDAPTTTETLTNWCPANTNTTPPSHNNYSPQSTTVSKKKEYTQLHDVPYTRCRHRLRSRTPQTKEHN